MFCNAGIAQELIKIPVHVHIVQIEEGDYKTITTPEDVREDFKNANWILVISNSSYVLRHISPILKISM